MGELFSLLAAAVLFQADVSGYVDTSFSASNPAQQFEVSLLPQAYPILDPAITASAVVIGDVNSGTTLWTRAADETRPMASLTKLMTALLILENHSMSEVVTVPPEATTVEGARMGILSGEKIRVQGLLKGLLIRSANDAAIALAVFHSGSESAFIEAMNQRAAFLSLKNTHFMNPHGLDAENHFSSARDLFLLSRKVLEFPQVRQIAEIRKTEVTSLYGTFTHEIATTNALLGSGLPVKGLKTGTTKNAGECLITLAENGNFESLIVVLGSEARFADTKKLLSFLL